MDWRHKTITCYGSVLFRGSMPPRPGEFASLQQEGIHISPREPRPDAHWSLSLKHKQWGSAVLACLRNVPPPPRTLIEHDAGLTDEERQVALSGGSVVTLVLDAGDGNVLHDRKLLLRFLNAVMGADGLAALDHVGERFWSRQALADELAHGADLDIESLYTLHAVTPAEGQPVAWLHSHGLREMGFFDFDILQPSEDLQGAARDLLRALAFAIVEGKAQQSCPRYRLARPGGDVRLVDVRQFNRRADARAMALRVDADEYHNADRAVVCDPARGLLSRFFGRIQPSSLLSGPLRHDRVICFSTAASNLMAERARLTYGQFRAFAEELAEFELARIVKLGYTVDGGDADAREHLWFEVHELRSDRMDATLRSSPQGIARLREGDRGWHEVDKLSDWAIVTPMGMITPRNTAPLRTIRARRDEFRRLMADLRRRAGEESGVKA